MKSPLIGSLPGTDWQGPRSEAVKARSAVDSFNQEQNWRSGHRLTASQKERVGQERSALNGRVHGVVSRLMQPQQTALSQQPAAPSALLPETYQATQDAFGNNPYLSTPGMASGGPAQWDARDGGPVPLGPPGVDTVPAQMSNGEANLDSNGPAPEYVIPGDMVAKFPGVISVLEALRQQEHDPRQVEARRAMEGGQAEGMASGSWADDEQTRIPGVMGTMLSGAIPQFDDERARQAKDQAEAFKAASVGPADRKRAERTGRVLSDSQRGSALRDYQARQEAAGTSNPGTNLTGTGQTVPLSVDTRTASTTGGGATGTQPADRGFAAKRASRDAVRAAKESAIARQDKLDAQQSAKPGTASAMWETSPESGRQYRSVIEASGGRVLPDGRYEMPRNGPVTAAGLGDQVRRAGGIKAIGGMGMDAFSQENVAEARRMAQNAEPTEEKAQAAALRNYQAAQGEAARSVMNAWDRQRAPDQPMPKAVRSAMAQIESTAPQPVSEEMQKAQMQQDTELAKTQNALRQSILEQQTTARGQDATARAEAVKNQRDLIADYMKYMGTPDAPPQRLDLFRQYLGVITSAAPQVSFDYALGKAHEAARDAITMNEAREQVETVQNIKPGDTGYEDAVRMLYEKGQKRAQQSLMSVLQR